MARTMVAAACAAAPRAVKSGCATALDRAGVRSGGAVAQPVGVPKPVGVQASGGFCRAGRLRRIVHDLRPVGIPAVSAIARLVGQGRRFGPVSHGAGDDGRGLRGCIAQRAVVEMCVDRGGLAPTVTEQGPYGGASVNTDLRFPRSAEVIFPTFGFW